MRSESFSDHFSQATMFWNSQSPVEQEHIVRALRFELGKVEHTEVQQHMVDLLMNVDAQLASYVAAGIGVPNPSDNGGLRAANARLEQGWDTYGVTGRPGSRGSSNPAKAPETSMAGTVKGSVRGRRVAILAADRVDGPSTLQLQRALMAAGIHPEVVAPHLGVLTSSGGGSVGVDKSFLTVASVMYDAVFVAAGPTAAAVLARNGDALHFVSEAWKHCKPVGALGSGVDVLTAADCLGPEASARDEAGLKEQGLLVAQEDSDVAGVAARFIELVGQHRFFSRQNLEQISA